MRHIPRLSLAQVLVLVAFAALAITFSADLWKKHGTGVTSNDPVLVVSPDGKSLAMNVSFRPLFQHRHPVIVQDVSKPGSKPRMFESHNWIISDLTWSADGSKIITSSGDHTIRIWDVASGNEIDRIAEQSHTPGCLATSPAEQFIATGDHPLVNVWDVTQKKTIASLKGLASWVQSIAFSPDGDYLVAADINGKVQIWETASWTLAGSITNGPNHTRVEFTPDGRLIAGSFRRATATSPYQNIVAIYGIPSLDIIDELPVESYSNVRCVAVSRDGRLLAAGHKGVDQELGRGAITIWDLPSRTRLKRFEFVADQTIDALEFSDDGEILYGASRGGLVKAFIWRNGQSSVVFARPGLSWMLALFGGVGLLVAWRLAPRLPRQSLRGDTSQASDGKLLR